MSKFEVHNVRCPDCGHSQQVELYVSINADRMRGATDRLIDGSWERLACEQCGHQFVIDHRLLYTNLPHRIWIVQYPWRNRAQFIALEEEAAQVFEAEYLERPPLPIREQAATVCPRICFGRPQLAEKLLAWRSGLDDRALESFKLLLLRKHPDRLLALGPSEMRLIAADVDRLTFGVVALDSDEALERFTVDNDAYREVADDIAPFRTAFPALFERPYVCARRYLQ